MSTNLGYDGSVSWPGLQYWWTGESDAVSGIVFCNNTCPLRDLANRWTVGLGVEFQSDRGRLIIILLIARLSPTAADQNHAKTPYKLEGNATGPAKLILPEPGARRRGLTHPMSMSMPRDD